MPTCKNKKPDGTECGAELTEPPKEWDMKPTKPFAQKLHIKHYKCPSCHKGTRIAEKLVPAIPAPAVAPDHT